ncbi:MAG: conserved phage C-terminal domain-containing protein [Bacteroidales bacterium]
MKIKGGYYIKARKIQNSDIANAPPHVREIWDWLIKEANHTEVDGIKRGTMMRSLNDISEGLCWYVGYRKERYSKSKCEMAMNWLRKRGMIRTTKTTRGMNITICNYDTYQDPSNYETNNEKLTKATRNEQGSDTINKNGNNVEERKEIIAYLNLKTQKNYKASARVAVDKVNARINEGYTVDDFKKVIDNKVTKWRGTKWDEYLRPSTLFGPKFEEYLNEGSNESKYGPGVRQTYKDLM